MTPFMTQLALVSPGCTRLVKMIDFLTAISTGSEVKLVTMSISTSLPARLLHKVVFLTLSLLLYVQTLLSVAH